MKDSIRYSMDRSGRIIVPKAIRERAGLTPGMPLEIRYRDGRVEIEPASREVRIIRKGQVAVAEPLELSKPLTEEVVRTAQSCLRDYRYRV